MGRPSPPKARRACAGQTKRSCAQWLRAAPAGFFGELKAVEDDNNVCGLPPIYLSLRLLNETKGETIAYDQCPADEEDTSWVSVAGMLWR